MNNTNNNIVNLYDGEERQDTIDSYITSMNLMMQNLKDDEKLIQLCLKQFIHKIPTNSEFEADSVEAKNQIRASTQQAVDIVLALSGLNDKQPLRNMLQSLSEVYPRIQSDVIQTLLKITDYSDIPSYMAICLKMSKDLEQTKNIDNIQNKEDTRISSSTEARTFISMMETVLVSHPGKFRRKINRFIQLTASPMPTISDDVNSEIAKIIPFNKNISPKKNTSRVVSLQDVNKKFG